MNGKFYFVILLSTVLGGCAGFDGFWGDLSGNPVQDSHRKVSAQELPAFPRYCLDTDTEMPSLAQCSTLSQACYQLDTGNWCSGPGVMLCPTNPEPLPPGGDCPPGVDCWIYFANLRCRSV